MFGTSRNRSESIINLINTVRCGQRYNVVAILRSIAVLTAGIVMAVSICGCATIINGTSQKVPVSSEPEGATVIVDNKESYVTPARIRMERRRDHSLVISKAGYESQTVNMTHVLSEVVVGNTLLGGPLGWVFDIFAGTQYKLTPNPVRVQLKGVSGSGQVR